MNSDTVNIVISREFSDTPGGRYIKEGKYSGEEFRESLLYPKYLQAKEQGKKLKVDFDGCFGFGTSFLEEAFGGIVRVHHVKDLQNMLIIHSIEDETIPGIVLKYIMEAEERVR